MNKQEQAQLAGVEGQPRQRSKEIGGRKGFMASVTGTAFGGHQVYGDQERAATNVYEESLKQQKKKQFYEPWTEAHHGDDHAALKATVQDHNTGQ